MAFLTAVVAWSLKNRPIVIMAALVFTLFGIYSAARLPVDAFPDVTQANVQIITAAPALSPVEIEQYVTVPVERAMAGIPRMNDVRSVSKHGLSVITLVFEDGTDIYRARQLVNERMSEANDVLPVRYAKPQMGPITSGLGEVFQFVLRNERLSAMELEEVLDWQVAPALRAVPGVVEVDSFGGEQRQYQVVLEPGRLRAAGISVSQVVDALEKSNANAGGGYIEHAREHFVIGASGLVRSLEDLRRVVISATGDGAPITIATVGEVKFGPRLRLGAASKDGKGEVVSGVTLMLPGENSLVVTNAIKQRLASLQPSLPAGTTIEPFYDRSILVGRTIRTVVTNLLEGALLVIAVLLLVLGDFRAGLVVATTIPLSLLFAVTVMSSLGLSGNLMSLGAIDFGLIVDGAVIIVENAVRRLGERRAELGRTLEATEQLRVVEHATLEVRSASIFGELIIAVVYLPLLALTGVEGKLFRPMALTVLFALAGAFILSLTLIPVLTSYFVRPPARMHVHETWFLRLVGRLHRPALGWAMRRRWLTLAGGVLALAAGTALFTRIGAEFVPVLDEGDLLIEARRLPGVALTESVAMDARLQKAILTVPEVLQVVSKTGAPELATDAMGLGSTDVYIGLKDPAAWRPGIQKAEIARQISEAAERSVPEVAGSMSQPIEMRTNELVTGVRSDVAAIVYGQDLEQLRSLGDRVAQALRGVRGAADVRVEQVAGLRYLRIDPDRAKLARYGLSIADVDMITESMAVGHGAGYVLEGERRFEISVKTNHGFKGELGPLLSLPLRSMSGQIVPLGDVASMTFETGPAEINRQAQSRRLTVEFNVEDRDLLSVVRDAQAAVREQVRLPPAYQIEWGGQFQHYIEARGRLAVVVPMALGLIVFLLWVALRSVPAALIILLNVPFAVVGGVVALWLRQIPFSVPAGVGFIALFGVAVLNGLVLVTFAEQLEQRGVRPADAIQRAAELRLRPVLMTALVAALGFLPMALSTAPGSEVQRPLATVVIGGLVTATALTLIVLPAVYSLVARWRAQPATEGPDARGTT
jgi:heavy metal efflux system protein